MKNNLLAQLFSNRGSIPVNRTAIKAFGCEGAIMLGELCFKYTYWLEQGRLINNKFYMSRPDIEYDTGLTSHLQRKGEKPLKELGIIKVSQDGGIDRSNYYEIDFDKLTEWFESQPSPSIVKTINDDGQKYEQWNVNEVNTTNNTYTNNSITNIDDSTKKETEDSIDETLLENIPSIKEIEEFYNSIDVKDRGKSITQVRNIYKTAKDRGWRKANGDFIDDMKQYIFYLVTGKSDYKEKPKYQTLSQQLGITSVPPDADRSNIVFI